MMHGLSEETYIKIKNVIDKYLDIKIKLFGSRSNGTYRNNSDIDLAVMNDIDNNRFYCFRNDLNDTNIIYTIDIVRISECTNKSLIKNIEKEGVDF